MSGLVWPRVTCQGGEGVCARLDLGDETGTRDMTWSKVHDARPQWSSEGLSAAIGLVPRATTSSACCSTVVPTICFAPSIVVHVHHGSVYPVNPKVAARAREGYRAAPVKSDALDAFALADLLRRQVATWRPLRRPSAVQAELQALVRDRERFVIEHRRLQHQLRAVLETYYPAATKLFSSLDRAITLAFLRRYPTPAEAERLTAHRLGRFLARQGYSGRTAPEVLIERIRAYTGTPNRGVDVARARSMVALVDLLEQVGRILAEIGTDMGRFPSDRHLASWARICPGTDESAGKRKSGAIGPGNTWLRSALVEAAHAAARTKGTYLAAQYRRIAARRGAKRAAVAVGHTILVTHYHMLRDGATYEDLGPLYFDERDRRATVGRSVRRLEALGYRVTLEPAA